jgi:hypothetical protein
MSSGLRIGMCILWRFKCVKGAYAKAYVCELEGRIMRLGPYRNAPEYSGRVWVDTSEMEYQEVKE